MTHPGSSPTAPATSSPTAIPALPDTLRLGPVHLIVTQLDRSVAWYQAALGLRVHQQEPACAQLGDGTSPTLVLHEDAQAGPPGRHAGLYHYALLYPTREELARATLRLGQTGTPIQGASDHGTHEAVYLADPDGIGIELAADRPREQWPPPEQEFSGGGPSPLDLQSLLATVGGRAPAPRVAPGLRVGHVHLHVGSIASALGFYRDVLGLHVWGRLPSAAFMSAGGYHHHLGVNVWRGEDVGPAGTHTVGLRHWTIVLDTPTQVGEVRSRFGGAGIPVVADAQGFVARDPWDIAVRIGAEDPQNR